jgi:hypothetical protein
MTARAIGVWLTVIGVVILAVSVATMLEPKPMAPTGQTTDERVRAGPYVAQEKALSATEDLRIVVVPSPFGRPLDVRCLIYRNREFQQVTFTCPDARLDDLSLPELDRPR